MRRQLYVLRSFDLIALPVRSPLARSCQAEEMEEKEMSTKFTNQPIPALERCSLWTASLQRGINHG
jgi:hypothetical protein